MTTEIALNNTYLESIYAAADRGDPTMPKTVMLLCSALSAKEKQVRDLLEARDVQAAVIRELRTKQRGLRASLEECANDLEVYVQAEYKDTLDYPVQQRRYERDMEPVETARHILDQTKPAD